MRTPETAASRRQGWFGASVTGVAVPCHVRLALAEKRKGWLWIAKIRAVESP